MRNQNFNSKCAWKTMNKGLTIGSLHTENFHISENDTGVMIVSQVYEEVLIVGLMLRLQAMLAYNHFFICYLAVLQPTLGHYQQYNLTQIITNFLSIFKLKVTRSLVIRLSP